MKSGRVGKLLLLLLLDKESLEVGVRFRDKEFVEVCDQKLQLS